MSHTRKVKKTWLVLNKILKDRVGRSNPALMQAKEESIHIIGDVLVAANNVQLQLEALESKPSRILRLAEQLGERTATP